MSIMTSSTLQTSTTLDSSRFCQKFLLMLYYCGPVYLFVKYNFVQIKIVIIIYVKGTRERPVSLKR
jgi:hypothetical protein